MDLRRQGASGTKAHTDMDEIIYLTPKFAVTSQLAAADFPQLAEIGFRAVINNRPDGEEESQLPGLEAARGALAAGLQYRAIPAAKLDLFTDPVVGAMESALDHLEGPVIAYCKSGLRSMIVWAAASARRRDVSDVLADLKSAGQDLDFLRDELDAQADRKHWMPEAAISLDERSAGTLVAAA